MEISAQIIVSYHNVLRRLGSKSGVYSPRRRRKNQSPRPASFLVINGFVGIRRLSLHAISPLCIGILLVMTYRLDRLAYFGADTFNNLQAQQSESLANVIRRITNSVSLYYRPVGML